MARENESPFICHIFVCTHDREGKKQSCANDNSVQIRKALKEEIGSRNLKMSVRVSQSGCLGLCDKGPNVIIYPQKIWFSDVSTDDVEMIMLRVMELLRGRGEA